MARIVTACAVADCDKLTGVPGTARGYCTLHYQRWQKYGDAEAPSQKRQRTYCTMPECEKPTAGRGLCGAHWYHWKQYGDPARRFVGEIRDGKRVCSRCREDKPLAEFGRNKTTTTGHQTYCRTCSYAKKREWLAAHPEYVAPVSPSRTPEASRESVKGWRRRNPDRQKANFMAYKARKRHAFVEVVSALAVYERDSWTCGICKEAIDPETRHPDLMSASVDHIIPLAKHGKHSYANVQASHLVCNIRKGDRVLVRCGE